MWPQCDSAQATVMLQAASYRLHAPTCRPQASGHRLQNKFPLQLGAWSLQLNRLVACSLHLAAWSVGLLTCLILIAVPMSWAEESPKESVTVRKTSERLNFNLPPDWPIEKRGGIMAPIPIEEYLARKFKAIESRLQGVEEHLNGLDVRLRVLEEEAKKQRS